MDVALLMLALANDVVSVTINTSTEGFQNDADCDPLQNSDSCLGFFMKVLYKHWQPVFHEGTVQTLADKRKFK